MLSRPKWLLRRRVSRNRSRAPFGVELSANDDQAVSYFGHECWELESRRSVISAFVTDSVNPVLYRMVPDGADKLCGSRRVAFSGSTDAPQLGSEAQQAMLTALRSTSARSHRPLPAAPAPPPGHVRAAAPPLPAERTIVPRKTGEAIQSEQTANLIKPVGQRTAEVAKRLALAKVFSHNQDPQETSAALAGGQQVVQLPR